MSALLHGGSARSDSPSVLNVHGCAVGRALDGREVVAGFHSRLTGGTGKELLQAMERCVRERVLRPTGKPTEYIVIKGERLAVHSVGSEQLLYLVVTRADYPPRVVFGRAEAEMEAGFAMALLPQLASETFDLVGLALTQAPTSSGSISGVRIVNLQPRAVQAMERVCADFETPRKFDKITDVQAQVDEVTSVMNDNVQQMLQNSEQLSILSEKADLANTQAGYFSKAARDARRKEECEVYKSRAIMGTIVAGGLLLLFWWIF